MLGHRKRKVQVGRGLGTIFSTIFRKVAPIARTLFNVGKRLFKSAPVQRVAKSAADSALDSGVRVIDDVVQGKNLKDSLKENITKVANDVGNKAASEAVGFLQRQKMDKVKKKRKPPKKRRRMDVFD